MRRTKGPDRNLKLPPLQPEQQAMVIGNLMLALQMTLRKYIEALGEGRIEEYGEFRDELLKAFKNADYTGTPMEMEPAVIEATNTIIEGIMPVIQRYDGSLDGQSE